MNPGHVILLLGFRLGLDHTETNKIHGELNTSLSAVKKDKITRAMRLYSKLRGYL
jgi:hypothetical protein